MTRARPPLSPEDHALWDRVARQARPLHPRPAVPRQAAKPVPPPPPKPPVAPFRIGEKAPQAGPLHGPGAGAGGAADLPVRMDRRAFARLKAGRVSPEARLDLHGMTLGQAHSALAAFILRSQTAGHRLVLVITGKGRGEDGDGPIPERRGVLRRQVPHWLHQPPLAGAVLQVATAHRRHGGDGAYYVCLRRLR